MEPIGALSENICPLGSDDWLNPFRSPALMPQCHPVISIQRNLLRILALVRLGGQSYRSSTAAVIECVIQNDKRWHMTNMAPRS